MASNLNAQRCEDFEIFVENLPYADGFTLHNYQHKVGLFANACTSGKRQWTKEKSYTARLENCLTNALHYTYIDLGYGDELNPNYGYRPMVKVHKIVNPLTYVNPKDVTESNHFRPYAFVKCTKINDLFDNSSLLLTAGVNGIKFEGSKLRLTISDDIITNSKEKKSSLNTRENFEIFVGNLPYSEDLTYDAYLQKRGLFASACTSGRRPWKLEKRYIEKLETHLTEFLKNAVEYEFGYEFDEIESFVKVHKIVNPLTFEDPKEATESNHFRPYAFVKCTDGPEGRLLLKFVKMYGIIFEGSNLRLAISEGIPSHLPNNISDDIATNRKKKTSDGLDPLEIASSYLDDINSELRGMTDPGFIKINTPEHKKFEEQKEFDNKIVKAQGMYLAIDLNFHYT